MSIPRICWRRAVRQTVPSCIRRNTQAAYAPARQTFAAGGLNVPNRFRPEIREYGIRNPNDDPRETPLYTPQGLRIAWDDYQGTMVDRVNELTAGGPVYGKEVRDIMLQTARDPLNAHLFNHASMAFNNELYFGGISQEGPTIMSHTLKEKLIADFGSIEILRSEMLAMAYAMFGPGFVWLVRTERKGITHNQFSEPKFRLLSTYTAGSPLAGAHNRHQPVDMNTQNASSAEAAGGLQGLSEQQRQLQLDQRMRQSQVQNSVGAMGSLSKQNPAAMKTSFGGVHIMPCLAVNTWQHAWLPDHGINGKMAFLEKWWDLIDWAQVENLSGVGNEREKEFGSAFSHPSRFLRN